MPSAISLILVSMAALHGEMWLDFAHLMYIRVYRNFGLVNNDAHDSAIEIVMARTYTLKRRAEQQAETRRRIVEAAVDLHGSVGPALTTFSMVAERAGVQRHTLYAHFPDERSLFLACSGLVDERDPLPEAAAWRDIGIGASGSRPAFARSMTGTSATPTLLACVLRDAEHHALTQRDRRLRFGPSMAAWHEVLGAELEREAARGAAAGPQLLHMADAGARRRPEQAAAVERNGPGHRLRK